MVRWIIALAALMTTASACGRGPEYAPGYVVLRINEISVATSIPPIFYFNVTITSHAGATGATMALGNFRLVMGGATYAARMPAAGEPEVCTASMVVPTNGSATCRVSFVVTGPGLSGVLEYRNPSPAYSATDIFWIP